MTATDSPPATSTASRGHGGLHRGYVAATCVIVAVLATAFFAQDPIEARHRPWQGPHVSEDGWYYYYYVRSAVLDGDLDLDNEYREFGNWYGFGVTPTGRRHNVFGIGPALFWAPGFIVGHVIAMFPALAGRDVVANGMSRPEQAGALFTSFLAAITACWLAYRLSCRLVPAATAWCGTTLAFLGGPLVWYALYSPSMPHALEALLGAAFLSALLPLRRRTLGEAVSIGVIGGGLLLVRPQLITLFAPLAWEAATRWPRAERRLALATYLAIGLATLLVFSPQLFVWKAVYGSYLVVPQGSGFLRLEASLWSETLFSSRHGLFTTTPLLWFVLPGLYLVWRHDRGLGVTLGTVVLLQAYVNGAAWDWWGGGAFGGRRFAATFPVWAIALSFLLERLRSVSRRHPASAGFALAVTVSLLGLQWGMIQAHHTRKFSWEHTVPFDDRVRSATNGWVVHAGASGNPFAFPANMVFALRYGVPLSRYDRAVGPYLLDERVPTTSPLVPSKRRETVAFTDAWTIAFLGRGFAQGRAGAVLIQDHGELLLPLNRPGSLTLELDVEGVSDELEWAFNGRPVQGPPLHIPGEWVERGINRLAVTGGTATIRALTLTEGPEWPPAWATAYQASRP